MTRSKSLKLMKYKLECMERNVRGQGECNNECEECDLCYLQGTIGEQIECTKIAIESLKHESVVDRLKEYIESEKYISKMEILDVIEQFSSEVDV